MTNLRNWVGMKSFPSYRIQPVGVVLRSFLRECQYLLKCLSVSQFFPSIIWNKFLLCGSLLVTSAIKFSPNTLYNCFK